MPKSEIYKSEMDALLGKKLSFEELQEVMLMALKADVEDEKDGVMNVKFEDTNRPDIWGVEGIARQLRPILGLEKGIKRYKVKSSEFTVNVDKSVEPIRPFIACAVVKGLKLTDIAIKSFMQLQDKLDSGPGRKRSKTSIGLYNLDLLSFPIAYTTVEPDEVKFVPLGFEKEMTPKQILKEHPKGLEYGHLISSHKNFPILMDAKGAVLSLPPVINSNDLGHVTDSTENVLVEVTGTNHETVLAVLNLVVSALAERSGEVYSITVNYKGKKETLPDFDPKKFSFKPSELKKVSGLELDSRQITHLLEKFGYGVHRADLNHDLVEIEIPFYRTDIMHPVDVFEDILISYGYNEIKSILPKLQTVGKLSSKTNRTNYIRETVVGAGFQEILSFVLTSKELLFDKKAVEIENPISSNYNVLRNSLLPEMLNFLSINKTIEFPQKVFELGSVISFDSKAENKTAQKQQLCAAVTHSKANFSELKSCLDFLMEQLGYDYMLKEISDKNFIDGRCGEIIVDKKSIGLIGEIHPSVLNSFKLENPAVVFEINVDEL